MEYIDQLFPYIFAELVLSEQRFSFLQQITQLQQNQLSPQDALILTWKKIALLIQDGQLNAAQTALEACKAQGIYDVHCLKFQADLAVQRAEFSQAAALYQQALAQQADFLPAHLGNIQLALAQGQPQQAAALLGQLAEQPATQALYGLYAARLAFAQQDFASAQASLEQGRQAFPNLAIFAQLKLQNLLHCGDLSAAQQCIAQSKQQYPQAIFPHYYQAELLRLQKQANAALLLWEQLSQQRADNLWLWQGKAAFFLQYAHLEQAERCLQQADNLQPEHLDTQLLKVELELQQQKYAQAATNINQLAACYPLNLDVKLLKAKFLQANQQNEQLEKNLQSLLGTELRLPALLLTYAHMRKRAVAAEREKFLQFALSHHPQHPELLSLYAEQCQTPMQLAALLQPLRQQPEFAQVCIYLQAVHYQQQAHWPLAIEAWKKYLADNSLDLTARQLLGQCYIKGLDFEQAKACYQSVLQYSPGCVAAYSGLYEIALAENDYRAVLKHCIQITRLSERKESTYLILIMALIYSNRLRFAKTATFSLAEKYQHSSPDYAALLLTNYYYLLKDYPQAAKYITQIRKHSTLTSKIHNDLKLLAGDVRSYQQWYLKPLAQPGMKAVLQENQQQSQQLNETYRSQTVIQPADMLRYQQAHLQLETIYQTLGPAHLMQAQSQQAAPFLQALSQLLAQQQHAQAAAYIEQQFAQLCVYLRAEILANLLHIQAHCYLQDGQTSHALAALRTAIEYYRGDVVIFNSYHNLMRQLFPVERSRQPLLVMILSCDKYLGRARLLQQSLANMPYADVVIMHADEQGTDYRLQAGELIVPAADSYSGLPEKIFNALHFLSLNTQYRGVLKIDDNCLLQHPESFAALLTYLKDTLPDYAGTPNQVQDSTYHFGRTGDANTNRIAKQRFARFFCLGGEGYFLSKKALDMICRQGLRYPSYIENSLYEDVMLGEILSAAGIQPLAINLLKNGGLLNSPFEIRADMLEILP